MIFPGEQQPLSAPPMIPPGITIEQYIISNDPDGVAELVMAYGMEKPPDIESLAAAVDHLETQQGEKFIADLIKLHPDSNLLGFSQDPNDKIGSILNQYWVKLPTWAKAIGLVVLVYGSYRFYMTSSKTL